MGPRYTFFSKDIVMLQKVQRRATKLVKRFTNSSYEERLTRLMLYRLEERRVRGHLIETFDKVANWEGEYKAR